jgi:hypothetical protein
MLTSAWQRVLELPPRTRYLGAGCLAVLVVLVLVLMMRGDPPAELGVAESPTAPLPVDAVPTTPETPLVPETPADGTTVAEPGGVAPINSSGASSSSGGGRLGTAADQAAEDELNRLLPPKQERESIEEIQARADPDVKYAGGILSIWSRTMQGCLTKGGAPLTCLGAADTAAPGVEYQNGSLVGSLQTDVEFQIFRLTPGGSKVWLMFSQGTECHGHGSNFEKCAAW